MSFILDALRKSENARQRHGGPALAEVPIARRREGKPWWIAGVVVLLVVNLGVLLFVLLGNREPEPAGPVVAQAPAPAAAGSTAPPAPAQVAQAAPPPVASALPPAPPAQPPVSRSLADEAAISTRIDPLDPDAPSPSTASAANVPDRAPIVRPMTPGSQPAATAEGPDESLPTLNELTGDRAANMPPMRIDIHVFSPNPTERFVFINMRKYVEGATLTEGPVVERIRSDGVVLNQRGFRFILPRQ